MLAISQPELDQELYSLATQASTMLDKMHPGGKIIEGVRNPMKAIRIVLIVLFFLGKLAEFETPFDRFSQRRPSTSPGNGPFPERKSGPLRNF